VHEPRQATGPNFSTHQNCQTQIQKMPARSNK
jgi:hypothetical protein